MLSVDEVQSASTTITDLQKQLIVDAIRRSKLYIENPALFSDIEDRIVSANTTFKAQILNATYDKLLAVVGVGSVDTFLKSEEGIDYAQRREINYWLGYMISSLYKVSEGGFFYNEAAGKWVITSISGESYVKQDGYSFGQRPLDDKFI